MSDDPPYVGQKDDHTGVGDAGGLPYTYEHVEEPPQPPAEVYRVTAYVEYADRPIHKNVYYVPAHRLDTFLLEQSETWERVVDIRPTTYEAAESAFAAYRGDDV